MMVGSAILGFLASGCTSAPVTVRPGVQTPPARVAVDDARTGAPGPRVIGDWYGNPITLPPGLTVTALVAGTVGKTFPDAQVRLEALWITSDSSGGRFPFPIVGRLRVRVNHGAKSTVLSTSAHWPTAAPTPADFQKVLDGMLGDIDAMLAMMKMVGEL